MAARGSRGRLVRASSNARITASAEDSLVTSDGRVAGAAVALGPDLLPAWFDRALSRSATGDRGGAIADYGEVISRDDSFALACMNRGALRAQSGDLPGALEDYEAAVRLAPADGRAWLGRAQVRAARDDLPGAITDFGETLRLQPDSVPARLGRGRVHLRIGDPAAASIDYGEVIRGWLGIGVNPINMTTTSGRPVQALSVEAVTPGSPAQKAGVLAGDIFTHIDGEPVQDGRLTMHRIALLRPGDKIAISVQRDRQSVELRAVVGVLNQSSGPAQAEP